MSNTAEALAALHAAEAELEAALAAEKAPADPPPGPGDGPIPSTAPAAENVDANVKTAPEVDVNIKPAAPDVTASSVPSGACGSGTVTAKYLDMGPGYLGPTAINGT